MKQLTPEMVGAFVEYLKEIGRSDGPKGYFQLFKRMVTAVVDKDLMKKNPCRGFVIKNHNMTLQKEIFLAEETVLWLLISTVRKRRYTVYSSFVDCLAIILIS